MFRRVSSLIFVEKYCLQIYSQLRLDWLQHVFMLSLSFVGTFTKLLFAHLFAASVYDFISIKVVMILSIRIRSVCYCYYHRSFIFIFIY